MNWYLEVLKKYAVFTGRARRQEFWMFVLFSWIISVVLSIIDYATGLTHAAGGTAVLSTLYGLAVLIPSLAVSWRRLHDTNRSGWWILIGFVPFVGWIILIVFYATEGTRGPNRFGPDPKGVYAGDYQAQGPMGAGPMAGGGGYNPQVPAGWHPDPVGKHELRYWDGQNWTSHVSDASNTSEDPLS